MIDGWVEHEIQSFDGILGIAIWNEKNQDGIEVWQESPDGMWRGMDTDGTFKSILQLRYPT